MSHKNYTYLSFITAFYIMVLIVSNITSVKITSFWGFTFDAGTILFPLSYIFWDILTEVYGYKQARRVIWTWFCMTLISAFVITLVSILPPDTTWLFQKDYENILWLVPRITFAGIVAYLVWEFTNSYILAKIKIAMKGKMLFVRTIASTLVWEWFDSIIFVLIAFYGTMPNDVILAIIVSNYVFKVGVEVLFTPLTYMITWFLKKAENEDYYDTKTNFNPLKI